MDFDIGIIGAGLSGLTSAILLAKAGKRVVLIEKHSVTAPTIRGFKREGCYFDTGFHYSGAMGRDETLGRFLRVLGVYDDLELRPLDEDCFDMVRIESLKQDIPIPYGWDRLVESFCRYFPDDCEAARRYFRDTRKIFERIPEVMLDPDAGLDFLLSPSFNMSLADYLESLTDNMALRAVIQAQVLLYGLTPEETLFDFHARVIGTYYQSACVLKGGGTALANAFTRRATELGIEIICGNGAQQILFDEMDQIRGIELEDGQEIGCRQCIVSCHPLLLREFVAEERLSRVFRKRLAQLEDTYSGHILYGLVKSPPRWQHRSNLIVTPDEHSHTSLFDVPLGRRPVFVSSCRENANKDGEHGFVAVFPTSSHEMDSWINSTLGNRSDEYHDYKRQLTNELSERLWAACPELKDKTRIVDCSTPLTLRDYGSSITGSMYGTKHKMKNFALTPQTRIRDVYMTGQAIVAPGLFGAVLSGFVTSGALVGYTAIKQEVQSL